MREAARHLYPNFELKSWDVMLIARPEIINVKEMQVEKALRSLLKRAGLW
jgi:RNase P protein component